MKASTKHWLLLAIAVVTFLSFSGVMLLGAYVVGKYVLGPSQRISRVVAKAPPRVQIDPTPNESPTDVFEEDDTEIVLVPPKVDTSQAVSLMFRSVYYDNKYIYVRDATGRVRRFDFRGDVLGKFFPITLYGLQTQLPGLINQSGYKLDVSLAATVILVHNCGNPTADQVAVLREYGALMSQKGTVNPYVDAIYLDATNKLDKSPTFDKWLGDGGAALCTEATKASGGDYSVAAAIVDSGTVKEAPPQSYDAPQMCSAGLPKLRMPTDNARWFVQTYDTPINYTIGGCPSGKHCGIDIITTEPIKSAVNGTIYAINWDNPYSGTMVKIRPDGAEYAGVSIESWHLSSNSVRALGLDVGSHVTEGQTIGNPANSGGGMAVTPGDWGGSYWTNPHVHFAEYVNGAGVDPQPCLK